MVNLHKTLEEKLKDECRDVVEYIRLADEVGEEDEMVEAKLKSIAYDEFTHAYTLCYILKHHGYELSPETKELWKKAKEAFEDM